MKYKKDNKFICKKKDFKYDETFSDIGDVVIIEYVDHGGFTYGLYNTNKQLTYEYKEYEIEIYFETINQRRKRLIEEII